MKKILSHKSLIHSLLSCCAGLSLVVAFAPFKQFYFAVLGPALWYLLLEKATLRQAGWSGFFFGLGQFGGGVSWVYISIHVYGFTPIPIAIAFTGLFVAALSLFPIAQAYLLTRYFPTPSLQKLFLVFPLSWVLIEWLRSWLLTGFPWLLIGYSQISSPLRGYIPILGEFGIGFLVLFSSSLLIFLLKNYRKKMQCCFAIFIFTLIYTTGIFLAQITWTKPKGFPQRAALIQGNIPQSIKWNPNSVANILTIYYQLTLQNLQTKIIIWPEAAVPIPKNFAIPFLNRINRITKDYAVSLFTGIPVQVPNTFSYYNALISLGEGTGYYYKRHLVPFGEYVPMANLLRGLMGFFSLPMSTIIPGAKNQPDLKAQNIILAPFICYEIAYVNDLLSEAPKANVLVSVSDDSWFGDSLAPAQHLEIGQFRAIQSGRDLLFASNNGITAIINDRGKIIKQIPQFTRDVLSGEFQPRIGKTPWLYIGNKFIILVMLIVLLVLSIRERNIAASMKS